MVDDDGLTETGEKNEYDASVVFTSAYELSKMHFPLISNGKSFLFS